MNYNNVFRKAAFAMFFAVLLLVGCDDKNNEPAPTTVEEDKENIQASFDRVKVLIQNFRNGNFYHFTEDFFGAGPAEKQGYIYVGSGQGDYVNSYYNYTPGAGEYERYECDYPEYDGYCYEWVSYDGRIGDYSWVYEYKYVGQGKGNYRQGDPYTEYDMVVPEFTRLLGEEFDRIANLEQIEEQNRFNLATFAGKYTWDNSTKKWNKTSANNVQVVFPSAENGTANCDAGITAYTDKACSIEGSTVYLPTKISSYFNKDGVKIAGVEATGDYNQYGIPKNATASIYAKPITLQASLTQSSASKYSASLSIEDETDSNNSLSISGEATLSKTVNNYTDFSDCEINNLKVTVTQTDLSITGTVDLKTLNNVSNPKVTDINACMNLEVFYKGVKTGTLQVQEVGGDRFLFIVYKDETKENTEIYYDSFITDIKNMFKK